MDVDEVPRTRPLYRREFEVLAEQGFFDDDPGLTELLDGQIYVSEQENPPHANARTRLVRWLIESVAEDEGEVRVGSPLSISDLSQPQPDFAVVAPASAYRAVHPTTATLVIEVADSSRRMDLGLKAALYAAASIPDYWVVDIPRGEVVVHRDPIPSGGAAASTFASITPHRTGLVNALHHPGVTLDVTALLG